MNILISACLLGIECRYNATGISITEEIKILMQQHTLIPACPEQLGGLCTPRSPVEILNGKAVTRDHQDVTELFQKGAETTLALARLYQCSHAILKERSPSCGSTCIYDGSFSGITIKGQGITAALLHDAGLVVINETQAHAESFK